MPSVVMTGLMPIRVMITALISPRRANEQGAQEHEPRQPDDGDAHALKPVVEEHDVDRGEAQDRTHGQVQATDEQDDRHPDGYDSDNRNVVDDRLERSQGEEVARHQAEEREEDDEQDRQGGYHALAIEKGLQDPAPAEGTVRRRRVAHVRLPVLVPLTISQFVESHDHDEENPLENADVHVLEADHRKAVVEHSQDEDARQSPQDVFLFPRASAVPPRRTAVITSSSIPRAFSGHTPAVWPVRISPLSDAAMPLDKVEKELDAVDLDPGELRRGGIGADAVDLSAELYRLSTRKSRAKITAKNEAGWGSAHREWRPSERIGHVLRRGHGSI